MQKGSPPALLVGKLSWPSHHENSMEVSQKTKNRITVRLSNPTPGHISRQNYNSKRYIHFYVHISTIYNSQDTKTTCPQTDEWINKIWPICTMEYYSAMKKERNNAIKSNMDATRDYYTKWSQKEKDKYHVISLMRDINLKVWHKWAYL